MVGGKGCECRKVVELLGGNCNMIVRAVTHIYQKPDARGVH